MNQDVRWDYQIDGDRLYIHGGKRIKLPTGTYFNIPQNNMLLVLQKTSTPNKTGIISGARVIDENYQGEFIASLINTSSERACLQSDTRFIQLVLVPINQDRSLQFVQLDNLFQEDSERGSGAFGSTGKH